MACFNQPVILAIKQTARGATSKQTMYKAAGNLVSLLFQRSQMKKEFQRKWIYEFKKSRYDRTRVKSCTQNLRPTMLDLRLIYDLFHFHQIYDLFTTNLQPQVQFTSLYDFYDLSIHPDHSFIIKGKRQGGKLGWQMTKFTNIFFELAQ